MIKTLFVFLFLSVSFFASSQTPVDSLSINDTVYTKVDSVAQFPGGKPAWIKYIGKNIKPYIGVQNGAAKGEYNVLISFTVNKDGTLKDFKPMTKYGYGFEEEVIRILKLSPKWIPAKKNGVYVNTVTSQNQAFAIF